jgi:hypothetical protein
MGTFFGLEGGDITDSTRTTLVRVPHGADSGLFGGWGVRI